MCKKLIIAQENLNMTNQLAIYQNKFPLELIKKMYKLRFMSKTANDWMILREDNALSNSPDSIFHFY